MLICYASIRNLVVIIVSGAQGIAAQMLTYVHCADLYKLPSLLVDGN